MRYDQLILKATIILAATYTLVRIADRYADGPGSLWYYKKVKGIK